MSVQQANAHYPPVSDDILYDTGAVDPVYKEVYPRLSGFTLGSTNSWTSGHPFDFYKRLAQNSLLICS